MKQNWAKENQPMPLLLKLCVKVNYELFYQEKQQVLHQNLSWQENQELCFHSIQSIQNMKKLLFIFNWE